MFRTPQHQQLRGRGAGLAMGRKWVEKYLASRPLLTSVEIGPNRESEPKLLLNGGVGLARVATKILRGPQGHFTRYWNAWIAFLSCPWIVFNLTQFTQNTSRHWLIWGILKDTTTTTRNCAERPPRVSKMQENIRAAGVHRGCWWRDYNISRPGPYS